MMKFCKNICIAVFLFLGCYGCTKDTTNSSTPVTNPLEYYEALNVSYGTDTNQVFDIYLPENRTLQTKVMILVHGGGWSAGDKVDMNGFKDILRQNFPDIAIVNINYRLSDANHPPYPMQTDDISSVINYLKTNRENYTISDTYGFIGVSAGAHLSLLWSYAHDTYNNTSMVCSIVGPTNFTDPAYLNNTNPQLQAILDLYGVDATTAYLESASPYHRVTAMAPPTILFYGGLDPLIPTTQGTDMRDKLDALGVVNMFTLYPDSGHGWVGAPLIDTLEKLSNFIAAYH